MAKPESCLNCPHLFQADAVPHADFTGAQYFCRSNEPLDTNMPGEWLGFLPVAAEWCPFKFEESPVLVIAAQVKQKELFPC